MNEWTVYFSRMAVNRESFGRISETDLRPIEYYNLVRELDILMQHEIAEKLEHATEDLLKVVTFVTTGSDARLEKGSMASPLEIIALVREEVDPNTVREALGKAVSSEEFNGLIGPNLEVKGLGSSMVNYLDDPSKKQPGRIADARLMVGHQQDVLDAKQRLGEEVVSMSGKDIDKLAGLERDARNATARGMNRLGGVDRVHFDIDAGIVYYNPTEGQFSFKIGPLRFVQNTLLLQEIKHVRREKDPGFFTRLSSSIEHRLDQLAGERRLNITRSAVGELQKHYAFFLKLYHRSEQAYVRDKTIALQLTHEEIREVAKRIQAMTEILQKIKIVKPGNVS